ncbi:unnamed protein product [Caretta caretta]
MDCPCWLERDILRGEEARNWQKSPWKATWNSLEIVDRRQKQQGDGPKDCDIMSLGQYPGYQHHQTVENFGETK